jgi:hypothetical protein
MVNCGLHKPLAILRICNVPGNNQNVRRANILRSLCDIMQASHPSRHQRKSCSLLCVLVSYLLDTDTSSWQSTVKKKNNQAHFLFVYLIYLKLNANMQTQ